MQLESIMLREINQSERQIPFNFTQMWNLRNKTNEQKERKERERCILESRIKYSEQTDGYQKGGGWGYGLNI